MTDRLATVLAAIDTVNDADPAKRATLYGRHMSDALARFMPDASQVLRIAARAQHIERWVIPRNSYPEGRIAYLMWRKDLQKHHAARTAGIMAAAGYDQSDIDRVSSLLKKERLKQDAETQALEDVICLVFLEHEAPEFIAKHDDDKVRDILQKTARKMSAKGLEAVGTLNLDARLSRLLVEATR